MSDAPSGTGTVGGWVNLRCFDVCPGSIGNHGEDCQCCLEQGHDGPHELFPIQGLTSDDYCVLIHVRWAGNEEWE